MNFEKDPSIGLVSTRGSHSFWRPWFYIISQLLLMSIVEEHGWPSITTNFILETTIAILQETNLKNGMEEDMEKQTNQKKKKKKNAKVPTILVRAF